MKLLSAIRILKFCLAIILLVSFCEAGPRARGADVVSRSAQADDELRLAVERLGSDVFSEREAAQRRLELLGTQAVAALRRLQFNRLIRSYQESREIVLWPIEKVLRKVEDEVYTKGAIGCDG